MKKLFKKFSHSHFWLYTVVCFFTGIIIFSHMAITNKSFVWVPDGSAQHFTAFVYFGEYLREIVKNFAAGNFVIPQFDFSIGFGEDILTSLHYYAIGDPLNLLSALVPSKYAIFGFSLLMCFRYYLAGLSFTVLAKHKKMPAFSATCGALIYTFTTFTLYLASRHPSFLNAFIYFPLVILGVELIFEKKRPYLFILSICLTALSSFYFFYVISFFTVLYIFVRLFFEYKEHFFKNLLNAFLKFGGSYLLGILMASIVFVPVVLSFLSASRGGVTYGLNLLYNKQYYAHFIEAFAGTTSINNNTFMGYTALALAGVVMMFTTKKENKFLKTAFIILTVMMMFPVFCKITNGFSYVTNRWSFVYGLLCAYIFATQIKNFKNINFKTATAVSVFALIFLVYTVVYPSGRNVTSYITCAMLGIFAAGCFIYSATPFIKKSFSKEKCGRLFKSFTLLLTVFAVFITAIYTYNPKQSSVLNNNMGFRTGMKFASENGFKILKEYQNTDSAVERYEENLPQLGDVNNALINKTYSTQEYLSLVNSNVNNLQSEMGLVYFNYSIVNSTYCDPFLYTIENTKYFVSSNANESNYGINTTALAGLKSTILKESIKKGIYENENYVPFGFTYKNVINAEDYATLNAADKRRALINAVVLNNNSEKANTTVTDLNIKNEVQNCTFECTDDNAIIDGGKIYVLKDGTKLNIKGTSLPNSQIYVLLNNITYTPAHEETLMKIVKPEEYNNLRKLKKIKLHFDKMKWVAPTNKYVSLNGNNNSASVSLATPYHDYYSDTTDFTINLGYSETAVNDFSITLKAGIYNIDSIQLACEPMNDFEEKINDLKENTLENLKIETNKITGTISTNETKMLYLSVPYSEYWSAKIDGKDAEIYKANTAFSAVEIQPGEHNVELTYKNTSISKGAVLSAGGFAIFIALVTIWEINNKKKKKIK